MKVESNMSGHWTDDQLVGHVYGVGPEDGHGEKCSSCQERLTAMMAQRRSVEQSAEELVSFEFLAAQRRKVYDRLTKPVRLNLRRWVSVAAALAVVGGGSVMLQERRIASDNKISDAELAADVAQMAQDPESNATAPLQALFEE